MQQQGSIRKWCVAEKCHGATDTEARLGLDPCFGVDVAREVPGLRHTPGSTSRGSCSRP